MDNAPDGQTHVCTDCGRFHTNRALVGDANCYNNAQLCYTDSLRIVGGRVVFARAVNNGSKSHVELEQ